MNKELENRFDIYQVKHGTSFRNYGFENMERLKARDLKVEYQNYDFIYSGELDDGMNLEDLYRKFNLDKPEDFKGHSLSVSDVVVIHKDGETTSHFVDSFGYKEVPDFVVEREKAREKKTSVLSALKDNRASIAKELDKKNSRSSELKER